MATLGKCAPGRRDPYNLDKTKFAKQLRLGKPVNDEDHPLRKYPEIKTLCHIIQSTDKELSPNRGITSEAAPEDPYYSSNEGMKLRLEVIVALLLGFLERYPETIENKKDRRQKLHFEAEDTFRNNHEMLYQLYPNQWVAYLGESMLPIFNHKREALKDRYRREYRAILRETGYTIEDILFFKVSDPNKKKAKHHKKH